MTLVIEKFYVFISFAAVLCFILFLSMERHWRPNVKKVLMATLRMLLRHWLVLAVFAALQHYATAPSGLTVSKKTSCFVSLLGLFSSFLRSSQMGSLPTGRAGVGLIGDYPQFGAWGSTEKERFAGSPLQTVLGPPLYPPSLHHPVCSCLLCPENLCCVSPAPVFPCSSHM